MGYQPIENYGIIGDMHSVALVGTDGSIDWLCFPHFDSPSVFAAILDDEKGGRFKISPLPDGVTRRQLYWPDTNVLLTRFLSPEGVGEITDYMPVGKPAEGHGHHPATSPAAAEDLSSASRTQAAILRITSSGSSCARVGISDRPSISMPLSKTAALMFVPPRSTPTEAVRAVPRS